MLKNVFAVVVLAIVLGGCASDPDRERAFRKLMVGYDGLSCADGRQERLIEGVSQDVAQANYEICMEQRY